MSSFFRAAFGLVAALAPVTAGAGPLAERLEISRGHAEIIRYAETPGAVILGDASIAVANLTTSGVLVLTALGNGATNVIVLDQDGAELDRFVLSVPRIGDAVAVRRAMVRETLVCDPACRAPNELPAARAAPVSEGGEDSTDGPSPTGGAEIAAVTD